MQALKHYGESVRLGHKAILQSLPRLLTLYFEFGSKVAATKTLNQKLKTAQTQVGVGDRSLHAAVVVCVALRVQVTFHCLINAGNGHVHCVADISHADVTTAQRVRHPTAVWKHVGCSVLELSQARKQRIQQGVVPPCVCVPCAVQVTGVMHGLIRSIPTYKWLLVLPQLTSRMCHVQPDVQVTGTHGVRECGHTAWTNASADACVAVPWLAGALSSCVARQWCRLLPVCQQQLLQRIRWLLCTYLHTRAAVVHRLCTGCCVPAADDCCALCVSITPLTSCRNSCSSCWWPLCSSSHTRPSGPWLLW